MYIQIVTDCEEYILKPDTQPIVSEDGELTQEDTSVNPDAYAQYVGTHVHRDPFLSRVKDHISYYGCAYLFFLPVFAFVLAVILRGGWTAVLVLAMFVPVLILVWGALSTDR